MTGVIIDEDVALFHYGIKRRSGRYPWGSGKDDRTFPWQHEATEELRSRAFLNMRDELRKQGMSDNDIAKGWGMNSTEFRATTTIARNAKTAADIAMARRLRDHGNSNQAIAEKMGLKNESNVRQLLADQTAERNDQLTSLSTLLRDQVDSKDVVDVGIGTEHYVGASRTQMDTAIAMLKSEGYSYMNVQTDTGISGNKTTIKVLAKPGLTYKDVVQNKEMIQPLSFNKTEDGKVDVIKPPIFFDSKRLGVTYAEKGGTDADGVMYVRPGVKDVDLGGKHYAQVRVAVDGTHYLKGMAIYKEGLPPGVDIMFNTNKSDTGNKLDALKPLKADEKGKITADSFGAQIKRQVLDPKTGKPKSVMNLVNEEGDWDDWSKSLAAQMLSKQTPTLAKEQLAKLRKDKQVELDEIKSLTNPTVRRKLLAGFADDVDSSAVHLQAKALDRQRTQVILPVKNIKPTEVFAPNFRDGERVVLVRYPHGGTFEMPELTVNNKNPSAVSLIGKAARDAIGINPKTAEQLSGADFDGDTVLVIPNTSGKVKTKSPLKQLVGFDPKKEYPPYDGMRTMDGGTWDAKAKKVVFPDGKTAGKKQTEMGGVSNLITDMTIKGASDSEIARAVKHSMVVIDAEKHHLNYRLSAEQNGIAALKTKYQGGANRGATTLVSRSTSDVRVLDRKRAFQIDPKTGEKVYTYTGKGYTNAKGEWVASKVKSTQGAETKDAHRLTSAFDLKGNRVGSDTPIERVYADHANSLKAMANDARRELKATKTIPYSPSAAKVYASTVKDLDAHLKVALQNAPRERQAQLIASTALKIKRDDNPSMTPETAKKEFAKSLVNARARVGAQKKLIPLDERAWEAIQAGAISNEKLEKILDNSKPELVKQLATPRKNTVMTTAKQAQARSLLATGRTPSEVADILGVPVSTLNSSIYPKQKEE